MRLTSPEANDAAGRMVSIAISQSRKAKDEVSSKLALLWEASQTKFACIAIDCWDLRVDGLCLLLLQQCKNGVQPLRSKDKLVGLDFYPQLNQPPSSLPERKTIID